VIKEAPNESTTGKTPRRIEPPMPARRSPARSQDARSRTATLLIQAALIVLSLIYAFPLLWLISTALKPIGETMKSPPVWIPSEIQWGNFKEAMVYGADKLGYIPFLVYARNTILVCALVVSGVVFSNTVVAYSFARLRWPGRDVFFAITLATMMVPFPVLMVPTFGIFRELDWIGTFRPLWVPAWFGSAFSIFLLRQFFRAIPFELSEAAKIDGASEWRIFRDVVLPLSKPAIAVVALFAFMGAWNDFLGPLIYLLDQDTFTLSLGLQFYQSQHGGTQWNLLMAASTIVIAPVIILFFFTQRLFIQGIALTGLKG
jgi:multiple sugar transport system permease protein